MKIGESITDIRYLTVTEATPEKLKRIKRLLWSAASGYQNRIEKPKELSCFQTVSISAACDYIVVTVVAMRVK